MAKGQKKPAVSWEEYPKWYSQTFGIRIDDPKLRTHYETTHRTISAELQQHPFRIGLDEQILKISQTNGLPLMSNERFEFFSKPFTSVVDRSYRHNILWNDQFPNEHHRGWMYHETWFERLQDAFRGAIIYKYADSPAICCNHLKAFSDSLGLQSRSYSQASEEGYYAHHYYVKIPVNTVLLDFTTKKIDMTVEIQITTQFQDALRAITHPFYENRRLLAEPGNGDWKWDLDTPQFKASYLGHTLHLLEGMIVEIRKAMTNGTATAAQTPTPKGNENG